MSAIVDSLPLATIVDVEALWQTAAAAIVGGLGIVLCFSIGIWGSTRATDLFSTDRRLAAAGALTISALGFLASLALAGAGIAVMLS